MSWFKTSLLCVSLALGACGFQPVYGPGGTATRLQDRIDVQEPSSRDGYLLTRQLETRLGRGSDYSLSIDVTSEAEGLAINTAGDITRYNLIGSADYALTDRATGQIVTSGFVQNFTGYSATGSTVATLSAERDAQKRLMTILADQIVTRLFAVQLPQ
ncbi:MAG: LPS assembly lipoprotein LptE [Sulfitobacter sp.]